MEIKEPRKIALKSVREEADNEMRKLMGDLAPSCPLDTLNGVSAFGTRLAFYAYDKQTRILPRPISPDPEGETDTAPWDRWDCDILEDEGGQRFQDLVAEIKTKCLFLATRHHLDRIMPIILAEIWHQIFALACTDAGLTGRSLSLVSKYFHGISRPLKYQSVAITRWGQLIAFSQLPDFQKKIKYLFIHCSYSFIEVEHNPSLASERCCMQNAVIRDTASPGIVFVPTGEYPDSDPDYSELSEDVEYIDAVSRASLPGEGNTRQDESDGLDSDIQAVFDKAIPALHVILNVNSSTLRILTLYWTSFRPLPVHHVLPPLPFLDELHLFRCSVVEADVRDDSSTTVLFPRLRLLFMSGDLHHRFVSRSVPKIAPNLTHFRFTKHGLRRNGEQYVRDIVVKTFGKWATEQIETLVKEKIGGSGPSQPVMGYLGGLPEAWHYLWSSRVAGRPEAWSARKEVE